MNRLQPPRGNNGCSGNNGSNNNRNSGQNGHDSSLSFSIKATSRDNMLHFAFHG